MHEYSFNSVYQNKKGKEVLNGHFIDNISIDKKNESILLIKCRLLFKEEKKKRGTPYNKNPHLYEDKR